MTLLFIPIIIGLLNVKSIESHAFSNCRALTTIYGLPEYIESYAFADCGDNFYIESYSAKLNTNIFPSIATIVIHNNCELVISYSRNIQKLNIVYDNTCKIILKYNNNEILIEDLESITYNETNVIINPTYSQPIK